MEPEKRGKKKKSKPWAVYDVEKVMKVKKVRG